VKITKCTHRVFAIKNVTEQIAYRSCMFLVEYSIVIGLN
jgi:hypothetical protein